MPEHEPSQQPPAGVPDGVPAAESAGAELSGARSAAPGPRCGQVASVLLAAGGGTRFGGRKPLALFQGKPLVSHALWTVMQSGLFPIVVVTGADAPAVAAQVHRAASFWAAGAAHEEPGLAREEPVLRADGPQDAALCGSGVSLDRDSLSGREREDRAATCSDPREGAVGETTQNSGLLLVHNADWASGIATSLQAALRALLPVSHVQAVCVGLADQPLVRASAYQRLATAWEAGADLAVATYAGKRRNPVLLARSVWAAAQRLEGDEGARALLRVHPTVEVPCEGDPVDVDTPQELRELEQKCRSTTILP